MTTGIGEWKTMIFFIDVILKGTVIVGYTKNTEKENLQDLTEMILMLKFLG